MMPKIILAYIPVLHRGYLQFLEKHHDAEMLYLLNEDLLAELPALEKDIRRLLPQQMRAALLSLKLSFTVAVIDRAGLLKLASKFPPETELILPDEDISHLLVEKYLPAANVSFDSVFLRWDHRKSLEQVEVKADTQVPARELAQKFLGQAAELSQKSADWWRQVGAVLVKDGKVLLSAYNKHLPADNEPYFNGDPRGNFHKGEHIELSTALHAEAGVIAQAAERGISLAGTQLYVTTFPCPNCAKLVAYSGITELYFQEGYAMVDGESIMKARGVKLIKVA